MNTRDQQKEKRREEILLAGLDLFVKRGMRRRRPAISQRR